MTGHETNVPVDDWSGVARVKLVNVLGEKAGRALMNETMSKLGLDALRSAEDLRAFAHALASLGGFAAAVGGLLGVHAAMYGGQRAAASDR